MTRDDGTTDGTDEVVEQLSPADEAAVHDLLAALPDPEVPSDVQARIAAAVAGPGPSAVPSAGPGAATVLAGRPPSARWRSPRLLQAAAAVVVIALLGAVTIGTVGTLTDGGSSDERTGTAVSIDGVSGAITASGHEYSATTLPLQVSALLGAATPSGGTAPLADGERAPADSSAADLAAATSLVEDGSTRQACIDALAGAQGVEQVAIDVGLWNGKPAAVIVLPNENNPAQVDVWVVGPTCSDADNPFPYHYARVTRP